MGFIVELIKTRSIGEEIDDCITLARRIAEREKNSDIFRKKNNKSSLQANFFPGGTWKDKKNLPWTGGMVDIYDCFLLFNESIIPAQNYPISKILYLSETL